MTTRIVHRGTTRTATHGLPASDIWVVQGGDSGSAGGTLIFTGALTNAGTIIVQSGVTGGELDVIGRLDNTGAIEVGAYPPYPALADPHGGSGGQLRVAGTLVNAGAITLNVGADANVFTGAAGYGGTLSVDGLLTNTGDITIGEGIYLGAGIYGGSALLDVATSGTLVNKGALTLYGCTNYPGAAPVGNTIDVKGMLFNTGTVSVAHHYPYGPGSYGGELDLTGTLMNVGLLVIDGGQVGFSAASTGGTLNDSGVLTNAGTLIVEAAGPPAYNHFLAGSGMLIDSSVLYNTGSILLLGGVYSNTHYAAGAVMDVSGTLDTRGYIGIGPGQRGFTGFGSILTDTGVLHNAGTIAVSGMKYQYYFDSARSPGTLLDAGRLTNSGLLNADGGYVAIASAASMSNAGTIVINALPSFPAATGLLVDDGLLVNSGVITLAQNAGVAIVQFYLGLGGTLIDSGTISGSGILRNGGTIGSGAHDVTTGRIAAATVVNDGLIQVAPSGSFLIDGAVSADTGRQGEFGIDGHATLTLAGAVAASQSIDFSRDHATLALGDVAAFAGILDGLGPQTTIDFLNLDVTSASASATELLIGLPGGATLDLSLGTPLPGDTSLLLTSDGRGGTDLQFGRLSDPSSVFSDTPRG